MTIIGRQKNATELIFCMLTGAKEGNATLGERKDARRAKTLEADKKSHIWEGIPSRKERAI